MPCSENLLEINCIPLHTYLSRPLFSKLLFCTFIQQTYFVLIALLRIRNEIGNRSECHQNLLLKSWHFKGVGGRWFNSVLGHTSWKHRAEWMHMGGSHSRCNQGQWVIQVCLWENHQDSEDCLDGLCSVCPQHLAPLCAQKGIVYHKRLFWEHKEERKMVTFKGWVAKC